MQTDSPGPPAPLPWELATQRLAILALAVTTLLASGFAGTPGRPSSSAPAPTPQDDVVVFVPGTTGSSLYDRHTRRLTWGDLRSLFLPRDGGYDAALPLGGGTDRIEPRGALSAVLGARGKDAEVYGPLLKSLEDSGYPAGDIHHPAPGERLFAFGYDWRRDGVDSARQLARLLDALPSAMGRATDVTLICHSSAGFICRWIARFGDVSLEEAEAGTIRPLRGVRLRGIVLIAATGGGALRVLREIDRGRRYVRPGGRRFLPEAFFTYEGLYRELPLLEPDLFVDGEGAVLPVDLADPQNWVTHNWSIFRPEAQQRIARRPDLFGDEAARVSFLRRALSRAQRLQRLLLGPRPLPAGMWIRSIQSTELVTPTRAVLIRGASGWQTYFAGDAELRGMAGVPISAPGDGHASTESQMALSSPELGALIRPVVEIPGGHLGVVRSPETHRILRETLIDPPILATPPADPGDVDGGASTLPGPG